MKAYIIESTNHGFFTGWGNDINLRYVPKFRWSIGASSEEVRKFSSQHDADIELARIYAVKPVYRSYVKAYNV